MTTPKIKHSERYEDGSGIPTVIVAGRFTFACDYLGEPRIHQVGSINALRSERNRAVAATERAFAKVVATLPEEWIALNHAMYRS